MRVTVADRGIGIAPADQAQIFEPFYRARRRRRGADPGRRPRPEPRPADRRGPRRPGHACKSAPARQRVHRAPAGGQRAAARRQTPRPRVAATRPRRRRRSLVKRTPPRRRRAGPRPDADRSADARRLRRRDAAPTARAASSAPPARRSTSSLLDVMLPRPTASTCCRELRKRGVETPVIMLTARGQVVDKVVGLKLGADDYVTKPFEMIELLARIEAQAAPRARRRRTRPRATSSATSASTSARPKSRKDGAAARPVGARVPAAALLHRAPRRHADARRAAQRGLGLQRDAVDAHGRRARRVAAPEDRAQPAPPAVHPHRPRDGLQVRRVGGLPSQPGGEPRTLEPPEPRQR